MELTGFFTLPTIHRFQGKFNVPITPKVEPDDVLFLWPGVDPYPNEGGLMQPVLSYGEKEGTWLLSQWFLKSSSQHCGSTSAAGVCWDKEQPVDEGIVQVYD